MAQEDDTFADNDDLPRSNEQGGWYDGLSSILREAGLPTGGGGVLGLLLSAFSGGNNGPSDPPAGGAPPGLGGGLGLGGLDLGGLDLGNFDLSGILGGSPGSPGEGGSGLSFGNAPDFLSFMGGNLGPTSVRRDVRDQILAAPDTILGLLGPQQGRFNRNFRNFQGLVGEGNPLIQRVLDFIGDGEGGSSSRSSGLSGGGGNFGGGGGGGGSVRAPDINYRDLPQFMKDLLAEQTEAQKAELGRAGSERKGQLVADLFGRGVSRSTIALDAAGRMNHGEQVLLKQVLADEANRALDLIKQDALMRGDLAKAQMAVNAQMAAARASAGAAIEAARIGASSQARSDNLRALLSLVGENVGALTSGFNSTTGALSDTLRNTISGFTSNIGNLTNLGLGELNAGTQRAGLGQENLLGLLDLDQRERQSNIGSLIDLLGLDVQSRLGADENAIRRAGVDNQPDFWERMLGVGAGIFDSWLTNRRNRGNT